MEIYEEFTTEFTTVKRVVNQEPTAQERKKERRAFASCRKNSLRPLWGVKK